VNRQSYKINESLLDGNIIIPLGFNDDPFGPTKSLGSVCNPESSHILAHNIARVKLISLESFNFYLQHHA